MGRKSKADWQSLLVEFEAGYLSHQQFCNNHGIRLSGFRKQLYEWRHRRSSGHENHSPEDGGFVVVAPAAFPFITKAEAFGKAVAVTIGPGDLYLFCERGKTLIKAIYWIAMASVCGQSGWKKADFLGRMVKWQPTWNARKLFMI